MNEKEQKELNEVAAHISIYILAGTLLLTGYEIAFFSYNEAYNANRDDRSAGVLASLWVVLLGMIPTLLGGWIFFKNLALGKSWVIGWVNTTAIFQRSGKIGQGLIRLGAIAMHFVIVVATLLNLALVYFLLKLGPELFGR